MTNRTRSALPAPLDSPDTGEVLGTIAALLWRERDVLEGMLFALVEQQLVLTGGAPRWLVRADAAVQAAARSVQDLEVLRAAEVEMLAHQHGLPAEVSLRELAEAAAEPWSTVLDDHRQALAALTTEIDAAITTNRALLVAGERATREALEQAGVLAPAATRGAWVLDEQA
ncbi:MAG: flagellar export chaperone FlgN [Jatrophihabitantaceae bacterium]